jgi:class 3 adenylate cyclase
MSNDECLRIFEKGLSLKVQDQLCILDADINALKRRAAAKGLLKSGATIREVAGLCKKILESRVEYISDNLHSLPFEYSSDLGSEILQTCLKYFPTDLSELGVRLEKIIKLACDDPNHETRVRNHILPETTNVNQTEINRLKNYIDRFILSLSIIKNKEIDTLKNWGGGEYLTLAIIFTDIVDFTILSIELGDERMEEVRQEHFKQCRRLLDEHKGYEVKTIGDSLMSVFRNVGKALDFAIGLQAKPGHDQLKIRAGIHIGQVNIGSNNDVSGETVNFTDRIVKVIKGPEIWLSDRAKQDIDTLRATRHSNLKWQRCEGIALKSFSEEFTLWRLVDIS